MSIVHEAPRGNVDARPTGGRSQASRGVHAHRPFRRDIQGLRAVAVVAVVLDHVLGWPSGGFVGVDVFFVISGFLITGLLLREHERTGRISLADFYRRRVRRILPAALVTVVATVAVGAVLTPGVAFRRLVGDAIASVLSVANWRFAAIGTDYFAQTGSTSPLQHFWSLAVEEQFYLVWPLLLIAALALAGAGGRRRGAVVTGGLLVLVAASFVFACWQSAQQPTVAYFSTFTRAWELAAGAGLAFGVRRFAVPRFAARWVAWSGLVLIAAAVVVVHAGPTFPGPVALLPVIGAVLVIAGASTPGAPGPLLLTNRVAVFIGTISYSWYLWHFPVAVYLEGLAIEGRRRDVAALVLGLVLAWMSYRWIEQPFQRLGGRRTRREATGRATGVRRAVRGATALVAAVAIAASAVVVVAPAVAARIEGRSAGQLPALTAVQRPGTPAAAIEHDLIEALSAERWPDLSPSAAEAPIAGSPTGFDAACSATVIRDETSCAFGADVSRTIVVFGDSLGITLLPTVVEAYGDRYHVRGLTLAGCAVADVDVVFGDQAGRQKCLDMRSAAIAEVQKTHPDLVLMIENSAWITRLTSGATGSAAVDEWRAGVGRSLASLQRGGTQVAVVAPSPDTGTGIAECATPGSSPATCVTSLPEAWTSARQAEQAAAGSRYVDTSRWYCVQGLCPAFSGRTPVKRDFVHPTVQYAHRVVPDFIDLTRPLLERVTG